MPAKLQRLLKIYSLLKSQPVTVEILKKWAHKNNINISERTFYRDLLALETTVLAPGETIVVTTGEKNKKTWKIQYMGDDVLTEFDINSYLLFSNFLPSSIVEARIESLKRIREIFYKSYSKSRFEDFAAYSHDQLDTTKFGEFHGDEGYAKKLEGLLWSIRSHRQLVIKRAAYDITSLSRSVNFPLTFLPLKLVYHRGVVHLGGFDKESQKLILLALSQITEYRLTNQPFRHESLLSHFETEMENRFGITENMNSEVYDVKLEFSEALGCFIKDNYWHPTQQMQQQKNGNFIMTMRCGINRELVGWIFMWMTNVRVISPPKLKECVMAKYREVVDDYEKDKPLVSNNSFRAE